MLTDPHVAGERFLVRKTEGNPGQKKIDNTTKCFTHGRITIDTNRNEIVFGSHPALPVPAGFAVEVGRQLTFALLDKRGDVLQEREGQVRQGENGPYTIAGIPKPKGAPARKYQARAYFSHPGIPTDPLPDWLKDSCTRQRKLWNRAAYACRQALRACSSAPAEDVRAIAQTLIKPAIDEFNQALGNSKQKLKYPEDLFGDEPTLQGIWDFVRVLGRREYAEKPTPPELRERLAEFARQYKYNAQPMRAFERNLKQFFNECEDLLPGEIAQMETRIAELEAETAGSDPDETDAARLAGLKSELAKLKHLPETEKSRWRVRHWECWRVENAFTTALKSRKTRRLSFAKGWPQIKYPDSPGRGPWGIQYYFNSAGKKVRKDSDGGESLPGLELGPPVPPEESGHPALRCARRSARRLRAATIRIRDKESGETYRYRFAVLEHRPLPEDALVKQWELIYKDGTFRLSFTVSGEYPEPEPDGQSPAAGLDLGWRSTPYGYRIAALYDPVSEQHRYVTIDFNSSAPRQEKGIKCRPGEPFPVDMSGIWERGPVVPGSRWGRRISLGFSRQERRQMAREWEQANGQGEKPQNTYDVLKQLQRQRDLAKDALKAQIAAILGDRTPSWLARAGIQGLRSLKQSHPETAALLEPWEQTDSRLGDRIAFLSARVAARLEENYKLTAHQICRYLLGNGIRRIAVEDSFLQKMVSRQDADISESLKRSASIRQHVAPAKFVQILKNIGVKYGILVIEVPAGGREFEGMSFKCPHCGCGNEPGEEIRFECAGCGRLVDQDDAASTNLSRSV